MQTPSTQLQRRRKQAFTLVELVTAAAIMSMVMLGVVEIFAIVTRTAAEAEAIHGASQQMRAALDRLNRDIRGMTREGYLKISSTVPAGSDTEENQKYHSDLLSFVTIGQTYGTYKPDFVTAAAEVVYTTQVETPSAFLTVGGEPVDHRRGVLARSAWLTGYTSSEGDARDKSNAAWLGELLGWPAKARGAGPTEVAPFLIGSGASPDPSLRRVLTTGASEFYVEYWDSENEEWTTPGGDTDPPARTLKAWYPGDACPKGIRVTLAVHDPAERGPPTTQDERYEGYALQEIFWFGAP